MCAGLASVTHWLHGQSPPCSRIGAKSGYAASIVETLQLDPGEIEGYWLVEADLPNANAVEWLLHHPVALADAVELASIGEARSVWLRARGAAKEPAPDTVEAAAAWWLWIAGARGGIGGFKGAHKLRASVDGFIPS